MASNMLSAAVIESVESICRDSTDTQYVYMVKSGDVFKFGDQ